MFFIQKFQNEVDLLAVESCQFLRRVVDTFSVVVSSFIYLISVCFFFIFYTNIRFFSFHCYFKYIDKKSFETKSHFIYFMSFLIVLDSQFR